MEPLELREGQGSRDSDYDASTSKHCRSVSAGSHFSDSESPNSFFYYVWPSESVLEPALAHTPPEIGSGDYEPKHEPNTERHSVHDVIVAFVLAFRNLL
jgi:hypothetical protein